MTLLDLAFDRRVPVAGDPTSERILDAALALAARSGLRHLTMDEIAARAGVGRMTVYRRFEHKAALVEALSVREARRCLNEIRDALDPALEIEDRVVAGFTTMLKVVCEHPLLARLAQHEPEAFLAELRRDDSAIFRQVREFLVTTIEQAQARGELRAGNPVLMAEIALRLSASFVLVSESAIDREDEPAVREVVRALLAG